MNGNGSIINHLGYDGVLLTMPEVEFVPILSRFEKFGC